MRARLGVFILGITQIFHPIAMFAAGIYSFSGFYFMFSEGFMAGGYVLGKALIAMIAIEMISAILLAISSALTKNASDNN